MTSFSRNAFAISAIGLVWLASLPSHGQLAQAPRVRCGLGFELDGNETVNNPIEYYFKKGARFGGIDFTSTSVLAKPTRNSLQFSLTTREEEVAVTIGRPARLMKMTALVWRLSVTYYSPDPDHVAEKPVAAWTDGISGSILRGDDFDHIYEAEIALGARFAQAWLEDGIGAPLKAAAIRRGPSGAMRKASAPTNQGIGLIADQAVTLRACNIFKGPDLRAKVVRAVKKGETIFAAKTADAKWLAVVDERGVGYVLSSCVSFDLRRK